MSNLTEIRPGFFQYTYHNGVTHSFSAPNRKAAERIVEDEIRRLEKRRIGGIGGKMFRATVSSGGKTNKA